MVPTAFDRKGMIEFDYYVRNPIVPVYHSHSYYEVYYFHEGRCNYLIGDKIYMLSPGDLIVMYGMTLHGANADPSVPYVRTIVHFEPTLLKPFLTMPYAVHLLRPFEELRNRRFSLNGTERQEVERLFARMHEQQQKGGDAGAFRMQLAFIELLSVIYERCAGDALGAESASDKERIVQRIISYVERNYARDIHLEQMEADLHFSRSYLTKLFKEVTGITIFEYVYRRRINEARSLFATNPRMSVTDVCMETGFKHAAHFCRVFKANTNMTPQLYRKHVRDLMPLRGAAK